MVDLLKKHGFDAFSISQHHGGMPDVQIIEFIKNKNALFVTEDKDFGELVFAHNHTKVAIIFLRYDQPNYSQIEDRFLVAVKEYFLNPEHCFVTISKVKTRKTTF